MRGEATVANVARKNCIGPKANIEIASWRDIVSQMMSSQSSAEAKRSWFEPVTAVLMALTTLATAWCSYESSRWSNQSSNDSSTAATLEREANALHAEGNQALSTQVTMFLDLLHAQLTGEDKVVKFYQPRMGGELRTAYDAWMAQKPFENPQAAPHPFVPELYHPRFADEVKEKRTKSAEHSLASNKEGRTAATYLANTVLFATVLFFAATANKFDHRAVRQSTIFFAVAVFLFAIVRLIMLPVA